MIFKLFMFSILFTCLGGVYLFESTSTFSGGLRIFHWPAIVLTAIGPFALVSTCSDITVIFRTIKMIFSKSTRKRRKGNEIEAHFLLKISKDFYSKGIEAFEGIERKKLSEGVGKMFDRLASRMPTQDVRDFLEIEREQMIHRTSQSMQVLNLGIRLTPSIGMLGTILGMVQLLSSLQEPSQIGSHMSLALLTTFYGLFMSLVFWTPLQQKVEGILDTEIESYNQSIRWLELIERRKPSTYFADSANLKIQAKEEAA